MDAITKIKLDSAGSNADYCKMMKETALLKLDAMCGKDPPHGTSQGASHSRFLGHCSTSWSSTASAWNFIVPEERLRGRCSMLGASHGKGKTGLWRRLSKPEFEDRFTAGPSALALPARSCTSLTVLAADGSLDKEHLAKIARGDFSGM